ncbi:MAG: hypothetical protein ABIO81_05255 [Ginsengibacter sp.]
MAEIKNNKTKNKIIKIRKSRGIKSKGVDTSKYCGTVKFNEDAVAIQKRLRNEWK